MIRRRIMGLAIVLAGAASLMQSMPAAAGPFPGPEHKGYFLNKTDDWGGRVIQDGIYPTGSTETQRVNSFISIMKDLLAGNSGTRQNQTGAEFIILTMMGEPPDSNKSLAHDPDELADWEAAVRYYSAQGWIDWDVDGVSHTYNTYWQGSGSGSNPDDDAYFTDPAVDDNVIVFHKTGAVGQYYRIRKVCGNPIADIDPLSPPPKATYSVALSGSADDDILAGGTYPLTLRMKNTGAASSPAGKLILKHPGASVQAPCPGTCNGITANMSALSPGGGAIETYRQTTPPVAAGGIAIPPGPNWYWDAPSGIAASSSSTAGITFTVPIGTPAGTLIRFEAYYEIGTPTIVRRHITITYTVLSTTRTPTFAGTSGDIHAGACTAVDGNVIGSTGSYGQYVVSATGTISGATSNGVAGGKTLNIGANGNYSPVCRPDLFTAANLHRNLATDGNIGAGNQSVNVATLVGKDAYFYAGGGTLTLSGVVRSRLTIVIPAGAGVTIGSNILLDTGAYPRNAQPSLAIISAGDINIAPAAQEVNAYLFSNGTINTCTPGAVSPACASVLRVNGFLMGRGIAFNRTGIAGTSGPQLAEAVNLSAQLYLNPPRFFDDLVDELLLEGQGEQRPLF